MKIACPNCGATVESGDNSCDYCHTDLRPYREFSAEQEEELRLFLNSLERSLKAGKDDLDGWTVLWFLFLALILIGVFILLFFVIRFNFLAKIVLMAVSAGVLVLIFGGMVQRYEAKGFRKKWEGSVKGQVESYLKDTGLPTYKFQMYAAEHLSEKSPLFDFIAEIN